MISIGSLAVVGFNSLLFSVLATVLTNPPP